MHPSPFRHEAAPVRPPTGGSPTYSASGSAATTAAQRMDEWMDATQLMNVPLGAPLYSAVGDAEALQGLLPGPGPLAREGLALPTRHSDSSLPARGSGQHTVFWCRGTSVNTLQGSLCLLRVRCLAPNLCCGRVCVLALQSITFMLQNSALTAVGSTQC